MSKEGLNHHVAQHPDPTYEAVLHNVRQKAKGKRKEASQKGFIDLCMDTYKCYEEGYVTLKELAQILKDEAGVEIKGWY